MVKAAIGLGSNLGDRLGQLRTAIRRLDEHYSILQVSSLFLTEPIGGPDQDEFLNAVVVVDTDGPPAEILGVLQRIEAEAGRVRDEHWGPRTLDLDLLTVQGETAGTDELTLPHPRAHLRRFVVAPLAEVWPDAPLEQGTAADHLRDLVDQKADRLATDWKDDRLQFLDRGTAWVAAQGVLFLIFGLTVVFTGGWPAGWRWLGLLLIAVSAYLMLQAAAALGSAFTPYPTPRQTDLGQTDLGQTNRSQTDLGQTALAVKGVYRVMRHPMYAGVVILFLGTAVLVGSVAAGAIALATAIFFWFKSSFEEKRLRIVYPAYDDYRSQVRGRLIPGVW